MNKFLCSALIGLCLFSGELIVSADKDPNAAAKSYLSGRTYQLEDTGCSLRISVEAKQLLVRQGFLFVGGQSYLCPKLQWCTKTSWQFKHGGRLLITNTGREENQEIGIIQSQAVALARLRALALVRYDSNWLDELRGQPREVGLDVEKIQKAAWSLAVNLQLELHENQGRGHEPLSEAYDNN